jgi:hypothetical protein
MNRLVVGALLVAAALQVSSRASAQIVPESVTFTAVDAVKTENTRVHVTGIVEGEVDPRTVTVYFATSTSAYSSQESCERLALLAMAKPGQYRLTIKSSSSWVSAMCTLARAAP